MKRHYYYDIAGSISSVCVSILYVCPSATPPLHSVATVTAGLRDDVGSI